MTTTAKLALAAAWLALMGALYATGPSDTQAAIDHADNAAEAPQQQAAALRAELRAQQAAHPQLWAPETIARADAAAVVVAGGAHPFPTHPER